MSAKRKAAANAAAIGADGPDPKRRKLPVSLLLKDASGVCKVPCVECDCGSDAECAGGRRCRSLADLESGLAP